MRRTKLLTGAVIVTTGAMILLAGCGNSAGQAANPPAPAANTQSSTPVATTASAPSTAASTATAQPASAAVQPENVYITVEPGAKLGPDGKLHDAYINGDIILTQGVPVTLNFYNYDGGQHSYTAPDLGLNVTLKGSPKKGEPGVTTYTFTPDKTGTFKWQCLIPCDGENGQYAMSHDGYMMGTIKVVPQKDAVQHVSLVVNAGIKLGSDGKLHDAYTPGDFTVNAGEPVELTVYNFDDGDHSFTSPDLGVNLTVKGSVKKGDPGISTVTFTPAKAGVYQWNCMKPCDGENGDWAMAQDGYMMGKVTVK